MGNRSLGDLRNRGKIGGVTREFTSRRSTNHSALTTAKNLASADEWNLMGLCKFGILYALQEPMLLNKNTAPDLPSLRLLNYSQK